MNYDMQAVNLEKTRIGSPAFDKLLADGWRILSRLLPPEYDKGGDVITNFFMMYRGTTGGNGTVDLTAVWEAIDLTNQSIKDVVDAVAKDTANMVARIIALEQNGSANPTQAFNFEFEIWAADDDTGIVKQAHPASTTDHFARVIGNTLKARFTILEGTVVPAGVLYVVPEQKAQPDGWAFLSVGKFTHWNEHHGFQTSGTPEWHPQNEFGGGKKGIRMAYDTYSLLRDHYPPRDKDGHDRHDVVLIPWAAGGKWYVQKRPGGHLTTFGGDVLAIEISL